MDMTMGPDTSMSSMSSMSTSTGTGMDSSMNQTSSSSMDVNMDMDQGSSCKMSMLWNWYTTDACFISTQWHIRSKVAFAFSVICVFVLVALVEGVRRFGREYDRRLVRCQRQRQRQQQARGEIDSAPDSLTKADALESAPSPSFVFELPRIQQLVRASIFTVQLGAAYVIMLLVMQANGFIFFAVILGGGVGHFVFGRDIVAAP